MKLSDLDVVVTRCDDGRLWEASVALQGCISRLACCAPTREGAMIGLAHLIALAEPEQVTSGDAPIE